MVLPSLVAWAQQRFDIRRVQASLFQRQQLRGEAWRIQHVPTAYTPASRIEAEVYRRPVDRAVKKRKISVPDKEVFIKKLERFKAKTPSPIKRVIEFEKRTSPGYIAVGKIVSALRGKVGVTKEYQAKQTQYESQLAKIGQLEKTHVRDDVFVSPSYTTFQTKWQPYIKGETFTGTQQQFGQFERERKTAEATQEREYKTYQTESGTLEQYAKELTKTPRYWEEARRGEIEAKHVTPLEQYVTYPIYKKGIGVAREYRERIERGKEVWTEKYTHPKVREFIWKTPVTRELARMGGGVIQAPAGLIEYGAHVPSGVEYLGREPQSFAAALPVGAAVMARGITTGLKTRPYATIGELAGMAFLTYGVGKAVAVSPLKVMPVRATFPKGRAYGIGIVARRGEVTTYRGGVLSLLERGAPTKPTKVPDFLRQRVPEIAVGMRKLTPERLLGEGSMTMAGERAFTTRIMEKTMGAEAAKITEARAAQIQVQKIKIKPKEITPTVKTVLESHQIPNSGKVATAIVVKLGKEKGILYGSTMQYAVGALGRIPRDFDVMVKNPLIFAREMTTQINKAAGKRVVKVQEGEIVTIRTGKKLFDIHDITGEQYFKAEAAPFEEYIGYGIRSEGFKAVTKEHIRTTTLREQTARKLMGAMEEITAVPREIATPTMQVIGRIAPAKAGRLKDIGDVYFAHMRTVEGLTARGRIASAAQLKAHSERWLETWGEGVAKQTRASYEQYLKTGAVRPLLYEPVTGVPISKSFWVSQIELFKSPFIVSPSMSISKSVFSPSLSLSISKRISPSLSKSVSTSRYPASPSLSPFISPGVSPFVSLSISTPVSPSIHPPATPSISPIISPSLSFSPSPIISPTVSPSVSMSLPIIPIIPPPSPSIFIPPYQELPKKKKRKLKKKKQWEWLEEFTVQRPEELRFGAIESGIPKVSKVKMLTMADITPSTKKSSKSSHSSKSKKKRTPKSLLRKKTNRRAKKKK